MNCCPVKSPHTRPRQEVRETDEGTKAAVKSLTERRLHALETGIPIDPMDILRDVYHLLAVWGTLYKKQYVGWRKLRLGDEQYFVFSEAREATDLLAYAMSLLDITPPQPPESQTPHTPASDDRTHD